MRLSPTDFWEMSAQDKAFLVAYYRTKSSLEEYERHLSEEEAKRNRPSHAKR